MTGGATHARTEASVNAGRRWPLVRRALAGLGAAQWPAAFAAAATPMSYLHSAGAKGDTTLPLTWGLLIISCAVVITICALLLVGVRRRYLRDAAAAAALAPERDGSAWLYIGVGASTVVLVFVLVWAVRVMAHINQPPQAPALTIEVTGQQWWWKARYLDADPSRVLTTANEIHIPAGQPVRLRLIGADVIHSFWLPALGGKTDTIPGQTNETWLQADRPGRYHGQCAEYCGVQHAHMAIDLVADAPAEFRAWWDAQLAPAAAATTAPTQRGAHAFEFRCGACHTVRGTRAGGTTAPDLTHLMSRRTIATGVAPNTTAMRAAWIANPQALKPGTHMPTLQLSGQDISDIDAYLATLK